MKFKHLIILCLVAFATIANAQKAPAVEPVAPPTEASKVVKFKESTHDFGKIQQGIPVSFDFEFTNTGESPVIIKNVQTSCGCTAPDSPKKPVLKGETENIKVTYNAAAMGNFRKSISVYTNQAEAPIVLFISGTVADKKEFEQ